MPSKKRLKCLICCQLLCFVLCACSIADELRCPLDYKETIVKYCDVYSVPYGLACAVIRTESSFDTEAKSKAGAVGLMQLMPSTAEEIALRLGEEYVPGSLTEPETSIRYGCFYLRYLYDNLGSNWDTACAAYNAGIGRVKGWLADGGCSDDGVTLRRIPVEETENYIEKIHKFKAKYEELYFKEGENNG